MPTTTQGGPILGGLADDFTGAVEFAAMMRAAGARVVLHAGAASLPDADAVRDQPFPSMIRLVAEIEVAGLEERRQRRSECEWMWRRS